ncbi:ATP-binding protein [Streptomyces xinghaiensis]|nr:ATP-binding protein [Streptomyces xinghaiensis]
MRFSSTPRGARLARLLVSQWLDEWGHPYHSEANHTVALITAELAANAVRHGRVPGRDFAVRLSRAGGVLRIEVSDTRAERPVPTDEPGLPSPEAESGRGLFLVSRLAARWAVTPRRGGPGKTVWAEVPFAAGDAPGG